MAEELAQSPAEYHVDDLQLMTFKKTNLRRTKKTEKESTWFKQMSRKWSFRWRYKSFWRYENNSSNHGTIIRTVTICKKIPCYIRDSACKWFIVKKAKLFWGHVKHILIYEGVRKCRILTGSWRLFGTLQLWGK